MIRSGARNMTQACIETEKRQYDRYTAVEGVIVAIRPRDEILGQMIDIGPGGLSFQYINLATEDNLSADLTILVSTPRLVLENIPFRTVADFALMSEFSFSSIPLRRRCVAFGSMPPAKRAEIEQLILYCTFSKPPFGRNSAEFCRQTPLPHPLEPAKTIPFR